MKLAAFAVGLAVLKLSLSGHLLVNITGSVPRGIYWISAVHSPTRGQLVALAVPAAVRELLYDRRYVPRSIRLLAKPVAAVGGDHVCVQDGRLVINGEPIAKLIDKDREGRPLPHHRLCRTLGTAEIFLATAHDNSFDSRNFGPVGLSELRGLLTPLLTL